MIASATFLACRWLLTGRDLGPQTPRTGGSFGRGNRETRRMRRIIGTESISDGSSRAQDRCLT